MSISKIISNTRPEHHNNVYLVLSFDIYYNRYERFDFFFLIFIKMSVTRNVNIDTTLYLIILRPLSKFLTPAYYGSKHYRARLPTVWWVYAAQSWTTWVRTVRRLGNYLTAIFRARPPHSYVRTPCPTTTIQ